ncbi:HD-GYP domain-containing protein [Catenovulum sediminis]|uniref:Two-component system response regulator n=1 Tax=Catenovulum sediminis TaxID=1740262 RepID=A0ABV1RCF9_9ALTE|nr:two-component system response regulator [Catenovulum sediminis]
MQEDHDEKPVVLVVDDSPENLDVLSGILRADYKVKAALSGERALKIANSYKQPDMILLDIMMPEMDGYEVCFRLKSNPATRKIPVIFVTAKEQIDDVTKGFRFGAVDYIVKPVQPAVVLARVKTQLELYDQNRMLEGKVRLRTQELNDTRLEIIQRLGRAAEFKDNETGLHVVRMSHYTRLIAEAVGYGEGWADLLFHASPMHDVGKIGIPDHILMKPGPLNEQEWEIMKTHSEIGGQIIGNHQSELLKTAQIIAFTHHEKWDGSGYPYGLKGEEIPLPGRIVAIADVFDALTSERPYKKEWSIEDSVQQIYQGSGTHFDPHLINIFREVLPDILDIKEQYAESKYVEEPVTGSMNVIELYAG